MAKKIKIGIAITLIVIALIMGAIIGANAFPKIVKLGNCPNALSSSCDKTSLYINTGYSYECVPVKCPEELGYYFDKGALSCRLSSCPTGYLVSKNSGGCVPRP